MKPVHVIGVLDLHSNHEALYVAGELQAHDSTIYLSDVAAATSGKVCEFSHITVELPDEMEWPDKFEALLSFISPLSRESSV